MQAATNKKPGEGEKRKLYLQHDRVACFFEDLGWCLGTVVMRENNGRYVVLFDDGTTEKDIMFSELKDAVDARPNEAAAAGQSAPDASDGTNRKDLPPGWRLSKSLQNLRQYTNGELKAYTIKAAWELHDSSAQPAGAKASAASRIGLQPLPGIEPDTDAVFKVGERVVVWFEDAGWYAGMVVGVSSQHLTRRRYSVSFDDGDYRTDVTPLEMLLESQMNEETPHTHPVIEQHVHQELEEEKYALVVGHRVSACDCRGHWCEARLLDMRTEHSARQFLVHFIGWKSRYDEWIDAGKGRLVPMPVGTNAEVGDQLQARDPQGKWADARVLEVRENPKSALQKELKVHYVGFHSRYDEWITADAGRLRKWRGPMGAMALAAPATAPARNEPKHGAKREPKEVAQPPDKKAHKASHLTALVLGTNLGADLGADLGGSSAAAPAAPLSPASGTSSHAKRRDERPEPLRETRHSIGVADLSSQPLDALPIPPPKATGRSAKPAPLAGSKRPAPAAGKERAGYDPDASHHEPLPLKKRREERPRESPPESLSAAMQAEHRLAHDNADSPTVGAVAAQRLLLFAQAACSLQAVAGGSGADASSYSSGPATAAALALPEQLQRLRAQLQCPVCARVFEKPNALPCQHIYCEGCIKNVMDATSPNAQCLVCRFPFFRRDVKPSPVLEGVVRAYEGLFEQHLATMKTDSAQDSASAAAKTAAATARNVPPVAMSSEAAATGPVAPADHAELNKLSPRDDMHLDPPGQGSVGVIVHGGARLDPSAEMTSTRAGEAAAFEVAPTRAEEAAAFEVAPTRAGEPSAFEVAPTRAGEAAAFEVAPTRAGEAAAFEVASTRAGEAAAFRAPAPVPPVTISETISVPAPVPAPPVTISETISVPAPVPAPPVTISETISETISVPAPVPALAQVATAMSPTMSSTTGSASLGSALRASVASPHGSATAVEAAEQAAAEAAEARVAVPQSLTAPEGEARAAVTAPEGLIGAARRAAAVEAGAAAPHLAAPFLDFTQEEEFCERAVLDAVLGAGSQPTQSVPMYAHENAGAAFLRLQPVMAWPHNPP
jgi:hypothetical protein